MRRVRHPLHRSCPWRHRGRLALELGAGFGERLAGRRVAHVDDEVLRPDRAQRHGDNRVRLVVRDRVERERRRDGSQNVLAVAVTLSIVIVTGSLCGVVTLSLTSVLLPCGISVTSPCTPEPCRSWSVACRAGAGECPGTGEACSAKTESGVVIASAEASMTSTR